MKILPTVALALLMTMSSPIFANEEPSLESYSLLEEQDDGEAIVQLGLRYMNGEGVDKSIDLARESFDKAAHLGNVDGMYYLGVIYAMNKDSKADMAKAKQWYEQAAKAGHVSAMYNLALLYQNGEGGIAQNKQKAKKLLEQAAAEGDEDAIAALENFVE